MTIKEIAKLACVSPSTVSKVINRKDEHISSETRERVLGIVEQYQYSPFKKAIENSQVSSRLFGVIVPTIANRFFANIVQSLERKLAENGYNLIICNSYGDAESEKHALRLLGARRVECVIVAGEPKSHELTKEREGGQTPYIILNPENATVDDIIVSINFSSATNALMQHFWGNNQKKVALIAGGKENRLGQCYRHSIESSGQVFDGSMVFEPLDDLSNISDILDRVLRTGARAILASNMNIAAAIYKNASLRHLDVGKDFSLAALDDENLAHTMTPKLTCIKLPFDDYAKAITDTALGIIGNNRIKGHKVRVDAVFCEGGSVAQNSGEQRPRIVVIGAINMDVMMEVSHLPNAGETIIIRSKTVLPGGKGANQAVGAAKLDAQVDMIGRLGNDLYGKELYTSLHSAGVNVSGVVFDNHYETGRAYVYVSDNAEYSIGVHAGANDAIDQGQIDAFAEMITCASYCLVQTEIPMDTVEHISQICAKNDVRMILKPSPAQILSRRLLRNIYLLAPNEVEINYLVPGGQPPEEKVQTLLDRGANRVVLTLGKKGCYYSDGKVFQYFEPTQVEVVDTTGASDAFICALAVYLAEGLPIERAITFANIAAGISITRIGVQSALADKGSIEAMYKLKTNGWA